MEEVLYTKKGTVRKRKPKKSNTYFTKEHEDAIIEHNLSNSLQKRNDLYRDYIHNAFYKLAENLIHTYKFYYTEVENIEDLKYEVISFLYTKIEKYDVSKGKAYSYFGTIAKRYLISYNRKNYDTVKNKTDFLEIDNDEFTVNSIIEDPRINDIDRLRVLEDFIDKIDKNIIYIFNTEDELKAADSILEIFKKRDKIDIFNKKAIFVYVRDMVDVNSNTITNVIKKMRDIYFKILKDYIENRD